MIDRLFGWLAFGLASGHRAGRSHGLALTADETASAAGPAGPTTDTAGQGVVQRERTALIVVHGVADQQPGDTPRSVVDLLVARAPKGVSYAAVSSDELTIAVDPLAPRMSAPGALDAEGAAAGTSKLPKGLIQSLRSDFQRPHWQVPTGGKTAARTGTPPQREARTGLRPDSVAEEPPDPGLAFTNFLLTKHSSNGAKREAWRSTRIGIERTEDGSSERIDVYEMYWADLSRLSGALPRVVTELFTLVFRLSKLGRDTVDQVRSTLASKRGGQAPWSWSLLADLQIAIDWAFVYLLALVFLQLALLAVMLAALGLASAVEANYLHGSLPLFVAWATLAAGMVWGVYCWLDGERWTGFLRPGLLCSAAAIALLDARLSPWLMPLLLVAVAWWANEVVLRIANERFTCVLAIGRALCIVMLALFATSAVLEFSALQRPGPEAIDGWMYAPLFASEEVIRVSLHAALFAVEAALLAVKWWWIVVAPALVVWYVAGFFAARKEKSFEARASIATGRLGLAASLCAFLTMTMTVWALISGVLDISVEGEAYSPCIFAVDSATSAVEDRSAVARPVNRCLWQTDAVARQAHASGNRDPNAKTFLLDRYRMSTAAFSGLAAVLGSLLLGLVLMFAPSVLAELKILARRTPQALGLRTAIGSPTPTTADDLLDRKRTERLGRWLTTGYRWLDGMVLVVVAVAALLAVGVATVFVVKSFGVAWPWLTDLERTTTGVSQQILKPFVLSAATALAGLTLLGGVLSKYVASVRGPLDIALDVDNHFREFPRTAIPRARIFSRYAALLSHVHRQGYDRIVIVSHSQGSVISAELLRFLASEGKRPPDAGARPKIDPDGGAALVPMRAPIYLLTLGCPLRQLYAARFPVLYRWVLRWDQHACGPRATDIGVARWVNAYCSGDYVGRWLSSNPLEGGAHPMTDAIDLIRTIDYGALGRAGAYAGFQPMPPDWHQLAASAEFELCLGHGAHTHYFDTSQQDVAHLIDYLIQARMPQPASLAALKS